MAPQTEIMIIAIVTAIACALPGVFLVLRKMSMAADSVTHSILLGIVLAFFITQDLNSPLLIIGATIVGVVTMWLSELIYRTRLVGEDASIGLVFPLLFSIAIILIARYAGSVHLDTDSVLLGELAFTPFERLKVFGIDIGPKAMYVSLVLLLINALMIFLFFKELKVTTFDPTFAIMVGVSPVLLQYGLMTLVSLTTVGAFQAVGSVLVVAFMIGPPATMYLLTENLKTMVIGSGVIAAINATIGFIIAYILDVSIAGSMATITGLMFLVVFLFSPKHGFISAIQLRGKQAREFDKLSLMFHLYQHRGQSDEAIEAGMDTLYEHMNWSEEKTDAVVANLTKHGEAYLDDHVVKLTEKGQDYILEVAAQFL